MNKKNAVEQCCLPLLCLLILGGCSPFGGREDAAREAMRQAENKAKQIDRAYKMEIREIKPYEVYSYQSELDDPFRVREFLAEEVEDELPKIVERCQPPQCVPPEPHAPQLLESYGLNSLQFVGTFEGQAGVGLIRTPDIGVVPVKVGDYMGRNNGKILTIKSNAVILQEKIRQNGLWENKKSVLMITQ